MDIRWTLLVEMWSLVRDTARGIAPLDMGYRQVGKFAAHPFGNTMALVRAITYQHRYLRAVIQPPRQGALRGPPGHNFQLPSEGTYVHS